MNNNKKSLQEKIDAGQEYIAINFDLNPYGYAKQGTNMQGIQQWRLKEETKKYSQRYRIENKNRLKSLAHDYYLKYKDEIDERSKQWRLNNPEKVKIIKKRAIKKHKNKYHKKYIKTSKGKISHAKGIARHRKKGFVPLNASLKQEYDWHHIHKELPFVIAIPRDIHRKYGGKRHCDSVNKKTINTIFVNENEDITSKEFVEAKVEILYPEQFRRYWFGHY